MAETSLDIVINAVDNASSKLGSIGKVAGGIAVAGVAALGAATVAVGKYALDMAMEYDSALDSITVSTGKTGDALDEMGASVKALYVTAAGRGQSLSSIADVMGKVAARTELVGKPLEVLTGQMLKLSNLTGTDASTNLEGFSRLLNQFGIAAEDGAKTLDLLYAGTQETGLGFEQLLDGIQTLAPVTQAFGLDLYNMIPFMSDLTEAGISATVANTGLKSALQKMQDEGIEPSKQAFADLIERIAGPDGLNVALDYLGAKAGPAYFQAIRDGKIDQMSFQGDLEGTTDSINKAITATEDYPDKWEDARHRIDIALGDVGQHMLDFLNVYGPPFADWFAETVPKAINKTLEALGKVIDTIAAPGGIQDAIADWVLGKAATAQDPIRKWGLTGLGNAMRDNADAARMEELLRNEAGRQYPAGVGLVPQIDHQVGTAPGSVPNGGAPTNYVMDYDRATGKWVMVNIYGNVTSQAVENSIDNALQGQGVR